MGRFFCSASLCRHKHISLIDMLGKKSCTYICVFGKVMLDKKAAS